MKPFKRLVISPDKVKRNAQIELPGEKAINCASASLPLVKQSRKLYLSQSLFPENGLFGKFTLGAAGYRKPDSSGTTTLRAS